MKRYGRYDARKPKPEIKDRVPLLFTLFAALLGGVSVTLIGFFGRGSHPPGHAELMKAICVAVLLVGIFCLWRLARLAQTDFLRDPVPILEQKTRLALAWRWVGYFATVVAVLVLFATLLQSREEAMAVPKPCCSCPGELGN